MLDDFILEQNIVCKTLINSIKNKKCSHAYIIETNGYSKGLNLAVAFSKSLLCPNGFINNKNCSDCNQCVNINKNEFMELKIISAEGQWIKKNQLEELQNEFSKKSIYSNKKVYIINEAEKLNESSANSILKFLEEPEENIVAILVTNNSSQLLNTIVSRCQILSLKNKVNIENLNTKEKIAHYLYNNNEDIQKYINDENSEINIEKVIEFIEYYEKNHLNSLIYINKLWNNYFKERVEIFNAITIMMLFYKDVFNLKINKSIEIFNNYVNNIDFVCKNNSMDELINKINVIIDLRKKIKFNINSNLLMDKLIISLEGCVKND